ncbi:hypothetical protein LU699_13140 [Luteimonas fraxinea]|uniref:Uncharacterized protein n=1 Tax=Luteimonas fraxinea TaxID=2901869 RepID=A0ABS8UH32_9GAMM|nr:hypothetical protein [Luteimonas fraxinea]MCD9098041.1 hypothetical protein [Luteimonas fraxinea]UHH09234.1 hypothetical protein LU699_13140 [Luteimonas fraxinea]
MPTTRRQLPRLAPSFRSEAPPCQPLPLKTPAKPICAIRYNADRAILPVESGIAERLLSRGEELASVYEEILQKLPEHGTAWKTFLGCCVLATAAYWNPDKGRKNRDSREQLKGANARIAQLASELSDLLKERERLENTSPFTGSSHYHICEVIEEANSDNRFDPTRLKQPLHDLCGHFGLKYCPSLASIVAVIGRDAGAAVVEATDPRTAVLCNSSRPSKADLIRAIQAGIKDNQHGGMGGLPRSFKLSDSALGTLGNVLLDLPVSELMTAEYVKNLRRRDQPKRAET